MARSIERFRSPAIGTFLLLTAITPLRLASAAPTEIDLEFSNPQLLAQSTGYATEGLSYRGAQRDLVWLNRYAGYSKILRLDPRAGGEPQEVADPSYAPHDLTVDGAGRVVFSRGFAPSNISYYYTLLDTGFQEIVTDYGPNGVIGQAFTHVMAFDRLGRFHASFRGGICGGGSECLSYVSGSTLGDFNVFYYYGHFYARYPILDENHQSQDLVFTAATDAFPEGIPFVLVRSNEHEDHDPHRDDPSGVLYQLDRGGLRARASGLVAPAALAVDPLTDDVFVATKGNVFRLPATGGDPKPVLEGLHRGNGLAFDEDGNLYVADDEVVDLEPQLGFRSYINELWKFERQDPVRLQVGLGQTPVLDQPVGCDGGGGDAQQCPVPLQRFTRDGQTVSAYRRRIRIPLGATFYMQPRLKKKDGTEEAVEASFSFYGKQEKEIPPTPPPFQVPLFPTYAVFKYRNGGPANSAIFQAVHVGKALVRIRPTDRDKWRHDIEVEVEVYPNQIGGLGPDHTQHERIVTLANARGIPPQLIKGHISNESDWNRMAYRYEPLSWDWVHLSSALNAPTCNYGAGDLLRQPGYSRYAFPNGAMLRENDRLGRTLNYPRRNASRPPLPPLRVTDATTHLRRPLTSDPDDDQYTAREIYRVNDAIQGWSRVAKACLVEHTNDQPDPLAFPAQTGLASSYGFYQVMYSLAVDLKWPGVVDPTHPITPAAAAKNPSYLWDTDENLALERGGSLELGSGKVVIEWVSKNGSAQAVDANFAHYGQFLESFKKAIQRFNPGSGEYSNHVLAKAAPYTPTITQAIFP